MLQLGWELHVVAFMSLGAVRNVEMLTFLFFPPRVDQTTCTRCIHADELLLW